MRVNQGTSRDRGFFRLTLGAVFVTFTLIVIGAITRTSNSGMGCGTYWPLCNGQVVPEFAKPEVVIEYGHRLFALLVALFVGAVMIMAWRGHRQEPRIIIPAVAGVVLYFLQAGLGAITVILSNQWVSVLLHLINSMLLLACYVVLAVNIANSTEESSSHDSVLRLPITELLLTAALALIVAIIGAAVAGNGAAKACVGWPLCRGEIWPAEQGPLQTLNMLHRLAAGGLGVMLVLLILQIRNSPVPRNLRNALHAAFALYLAQAALGAFIVLVNGPELTFVVRSFHVAFARRHLVGNDSSEWNWMVTTKSIEADKRAQSSALRNYLQLTKPRIVVLLIFTTVTAMVIAAHGAALPLTTLGATIVGGSLAAAGASALNQYIDREMDAQMSRTKNRPIPAGRIRPGSALIFGFALLILAALILGLLVNWLTASLSMIGALYYIGVYTLLLKRNTVVNIIIGGGAGAMPVLVGWAATRGYLDPQAFLLFAIIFYWTPPHSWALALLVDSDYELAKVPMMPVARGAEVTRVQILIYSVQLVVLTLLPFFTQMLGSIYIVAAILLGAGMLFEAVRLLREKTKVAARRTYKYSTMYLAILFLAMIIDQTAIHLFK